MVFCVIVFYVFIGFLLVGNSRGFSGLVARLVGVYWGGKYMVFFVFTIISDTESIFLLIV